ncbi:class I SAM-dependent methyltransferase [Comamonas faecalis]|uniref:Class I SAM-dependent methyltransferase n=1 Tax=Comamonas faecalis TaxID=1387849 RepID=A0ABP7R2T3_9BURK
MTQNGPQTAPDVTPGAASDARALVSWSGQGAACSALWRSEAGSAPPRRVQCVDAGLSADVALRLAREGTALLWRGDFQEARHLLQAMARRIERGQQRKRGRQRTALQEPPQPTPEQASAQAFHRERQARGQRAHLLGQVLVELQGDYGIALRRAPDWRQACLEAWGPPPGQAVVASLRELLGLVGAHEWRKKGVAVPALGDAPHDRIHPHYGVFSPVRGEYVDLVAQAPLPADCRLAFDLGTGTGVLAALLVRRGVARVVATDQSPRALACARENLQRLGCSAQVELRDADLYPEGQAQLVVCNPPWLPARPATPLEHAVYDEDSRMLRGFLAGLRAHLAPGGEGWLILSDLAEHLGLRTRAQLLQWVEDAGLRVAGRQDARPGHAKARDAGDVLHAARAAEITSLWRLVAQ